MARSMLNDSDDAQTSFLHSVVNRLDGIDFREDMMESSDPFSKLSTEITRLVDTVKQGNDLLRRKKEVREILYSTLRAEVPGQIDLYLVGSSLNGLGTKTSDIDLCLVMNNFGPGFCHFRVAVPMLRLVEKIFSNIPFVRNMKLILAKVPLLRFTDAESGLEVDLNFNNIVGIRNTQFIGFYTRMDKRFQPLVVTVKTWARLNNINNARNKTISSYTFVLMVIHYLQYGCDTPVLPCLHKLMPGKFKPDSDITKLNLFEELPRFRSFNKSSVGQLFLGFLHYYGHVFDFERDVVSVRTGGVVPKALACKFESAKNNPRQWNYICVEEPFERTNTAKSVYDEEAFKRIRSVFQQSHLKLVKTKSLFAVMNLDRYPNERRPKTDKCSERDYPPRKVRLQGHFQPYFVYSHHNPQCLPLYSNST